MNIRTPITRFALAAFLSAKSLLLPAAAQDQKAPPLQANTVLPSQLDANLEKLSGEGIASCLSDFDNKFATVRQHVDEMLKDKKAPEEIKDFANTQQTDIFFSPHHDVGCRRFMTLTKSFEWRDEGCLVEAIMRVGNTYVTLQMRNDFSMRGWFATENDEGANNVNEASFEGRELWSPDDDVFWGTDTHLPPNTTVSRPSDETIQLLRQRMRGLPLACKGIT